MVSLVASDARSRIVLQNGRWRMTAALVLLMAAASTGSFGLISGSAWWFTMVGSAALVLVSAALLRTLGVPRFVVPIVCALEWLVVLTISFAPGTAIAGLVPSPATFVRFSDLLRQSWVSIAQQGTPADSLVEFLFLIALFSGVAALLVDCLAITLRVPAVSAAVVAAILIVPSVLLPSGVTPLAVVACAAAFLFLLRADTRWRRSSWGETGLSLSIAAATTVIALLIGTTAPGFQQIGRQGLAASGISIGNGVNPLIDLGEDLRRPAAVTVLQYTTTADSAPYLRLSSLDQFTGTIWRHSFQSNRQLVPGRPIGSAPGLSADVKRTSIETDVQIENMISGWLPAPYPVTSVTGLSGAWVWSPQDMTITGSSTTTQGQSYVAKGLTIEPTRAQLKAAGNSVPTAVTKDLFVPFDAPKIIAQTAVKVTAGASDEYDKAVDLQNYFQDGGFTYSTQAPVRNSYDGDSMQSIAQFLAVKSGYCVHFASAMAIMARTLGIPARVAMGYLPGTVSGARGDQAVFQVTSDDLHSWPELYFAGIGWVPFEPTVSRGTVPDYTIPEGAVPPVPNASTPTPTAGGAADLPKDTQNGAGAAATTPSEAIGAAVSTVGAIAFVIALLLLPAGIRRWQRVTRLRKLSDDWGSPRLAWLEVKQTARDLGMSVADTETPRGFAARLRGVLGDDPRAPGALASLLEATEREEYGRPGHGTVDPDRADGLRVVLDAMLGSAGAAARVRAFLVPLSLLPESGRILRGRARLSA